MSESNHTPASPVSTAPVPTARVPPPPAEKPNKSRLLRTNLTSTKPPDIAPRNSSTFYVSQSSNESVNEPQSPTDSYQSNEGQGQSSVSETVLKDYPKPPVLNSRREAFFNKMEPSAPKFDPTSRLTNAADRGGGGDRPDRPDHRPEHRPDHRPDVKAERPQRVERNDVDHDKHAPEKSHKEGHKEIDGYVGFANLPNQVYRKSVKQGFEFTLMVVGESGLGKSTLINTLFLTDLYANDYPGPSHRIQKTVKVDKTVVMLKENGVQLRLTVVDTPGFGDAVDNSNCWQPIVDYIDSKYDDFLTAESRVARSTIVDSRVHCCLYFIAPTGHGLKPLDVEYMKRLHGKVNIIPIISKADSMTPEEIRDFKKTILNEIAQHKIKIYEFPDTDDDEENRHQKKLRDRVPFAVIGSNVVIDSAGKKVRGRQYPWGSVEVENLEHNDFIALRNMLIRKHMEDLKDVTNDVHYENYRYGKLAPSSADGKPNPKSTSLQKDPLTQMHEEKKEHEAKMKRMEAEMEQVFEMKVKEKKQKLKDSETDLQKRAEQMKKSLEQQQKELDEKWKAFEKERAAFEESLDERQRSLDRDSVSSKDSKESSKSLQPSKESKGSTLFGHGRKGKKVLDKKKTKKSIF